MSDNLLFVYPGNTGNPHGSGGQKRAYHLLAELVDYYTVHVLETEGDGSGAHPISDVHRHRLSHPLPSYLIDLDPRISLGIRSLIETCDIDTVYVMFPSGVPSAVLASRLSRRSPPVVFEAQSVAGDFLDDITSNADVPLYKQLGGRVYIPFIERVAGRVSDKIHVVSENDQELFSELYHVDSSKITVVPCGVPDPEISTSPEAVRRQYGIPQSDRTVVFHGTYDYTPNREAMDFLEDRVAPQLKEHHEDVRIVLAGKGVPDSDHPLVHSVGFVEDLFSFLNAMDIAAVPLRSGGGVKMKTLDYMSVGLPIVTTRVGAEGIELENGVHAYITAHADDTFIDRTTELLFDPTARTQLSTNVARLVDDRYRWSDIITTLYDSTKRLSDRS